MEKPKPFLLVLTNQVNVRRTFWVQSVSLSVTKGSLLEHFASLIYVQDDSYPPAHSVHCWQLGLYPVLENVPSAHCSTFSGTQIQIQRNCEREYKTCLPTHSESAVGWHCDTYPFVPQSVQSLHSPASSYWSGPHAEQQVITKVGWEDAPETKQVNSENHWRHFDA